MKLLCGSVRFKEKVIILQRERQDSDREENKVLKMPWLQTATHVDRQTWVSESIHNPCNKTTGNSQPS